MRIRNLFWLAAPVIPIILATGCASPTYYADAPPGNDVVVPAPTSTRNVVRVYPDRPATAAETVPADEWNTAVAIRNMIATDGYLKGAARNVDIEVIRGAAILRGTVQSEYDRQELAARIAQAPGITSVDNRLVVALR